MGCCVSRYKYDQDIDDFNYSNIPKKQTLIRNVIYKILIQDFLKYKNSNLKKSKYNIKLI